MKKLAASPTKRKEEVLSTRITLRTPLIKRQDLPPYLTLPTKLLPLLLESRPILSIYILYVGRIGQLVFCSMNETIFCSMKVMFLAEEARC
jgi:hypothetical protein